MGGVHMCKDRMWCVLSSVHRADLNGSDKVTVCRTVQCNSVQCSTARCSTVHFNAFSIEHHDEISRLLSLSPFITTFLISSLPPSLPPFPTQHLDIQASLNDLHRHIYLMFKRVATEMNEKTSKLQQAKLEAMMERTHSNYELGV